MKKNKRRKKKLLKAATIRWPLKMKVKWMNLSWRRRKKQKPLLQRNRMEATEMSNHLHPK